MKEQGQVRGRTASNIEDQSAIADLERQLAVAQRLLNFVPDQLKLLVDPKKLAYVEWNLSSTYTLQLMCKVYREGKMEVRKAGRQLAEAQGKLDAVAAEHAKWLYGQSPSTVLVRIGGLVGSKGRDDRILSKEKE